MSTRPDIRIAVDDATVEQAVAGEADAVARLVRGLQRPLLGLARRMMVNPVDAEDATQEALVKVVTRLSQYRGDARFSTWAWRVAVNAFIDFRGQRYRQATLSLDQFRDDLADGLDLEAPERADDAALLAQVKIGCGMALLGTLDAEHRVAYILGEILEMSGQEAAEILEVPEPTFRKRLSRARDRVRQALEETCGIVNAAQACRCHRRLGRACQLGRVPPRVAEPPALDVATLRAQIGRIDALERAVAFYRADPAPEARRDFASEFRALLEAAQLS